MKKMIHDSQWWIRELQPLFTVTVLATSLATGLQAQESAAVEDDEVLVLEPFIVPGGSYIGSLTAAAVEKQSKSVIIESIVAEDIGKLPDVSIAESLARLPGLTTQRINSRAQGIVIRGLVGDFSIGLLNGRQQVSTGSGRLIEFDQYPAELLYGVGVYKTAAPNMVAQGIAGTVDMRTVRPLSVGKRTLAANFFYEWSDLGKLNPDSDDSGFRYSANYVDQFADGTIGVAVGYSHTDIPGQGEQWNAWGYPTHSDGNYVIGGAKPFVRSSKLERDSYLGVIEYKPNKSVHSTIDFFYSDFAETQILRGIEIPLYWSSAALQPGYTASNGLITKGSYNNVYAVMRNDLVWRDAEVYAGGWNLALGDGSGWVIEADVGISGVDRKDNVLETYSGFASNQGNGGAANNFPGQADSMAFSLESGTGAKFTPTNDYRDGSKIRLAGPQGWGGDVVPGGQVGFFKGPKTKDELQQYKLSGKRDFESFLSNVELGVNYTRRSKYEIEAGPGGTEGFFLQIKDKSWSAPLPPSIGTTDLSFIGIPGQYSYDAKAALDNGTYNLIPNPNPAYVANNYDVTERITLGYVQFGLDMKLGDLPLTGVFGTQVINSEQESNGLAANGATIIKVNGKHDYIDYVPSANLTLHVTDQDKIRFSAARQLARQTMNDLRASSTFGFNEQRVDSTDVSLSPWSGGGGNPALEPWRSNSFDLSYEHYFKDNKGYWSIAAFYKDLVSYTYNQPIARS